MQKKIIYFISIGIVMMLIIIYSNLPKSHIAVLGHIDKPFKVSEIIRQIPINDRTVMTLYLNQDGSLNAAVTKEKGIFYTKEHVSGHQVLEKSYNLKKGDTRVTLHISWYDKGENYIVYGIIKDEDVAIVEYSNHELSEINYKNFRIVYGFGTGGYTEYKLYDRNGLELGKWKE